MVDLRLVEAHVRRCPSCREFQRSLFSATSPVEPAQRLPPDDFASRIVESVAHDDRRSRPQWERVVLGLLSLQILVLSIPAMILGDSGDSSPHNARHIGAFAVAYAVGLAVVVRRPARARTLLAVGQVLAIALVVSAIIDTFDGTTGIRAELVHVPELLSVVILWRLANIRIPRGGHPNRARPDLDPC